jgi:hypothetical protein
MDGGQGFRSGLRCTIRVSPDVSHVPGGLEVSWRVLADRIVTAGSAIA